MSSVTTTAIAVATSKAVRVAVCPGCGGGVQIAGAPRTPAPVSLRCSRLAGGGWRQSRRRHHAAARATSTSSAVALSEGLRWCAASTFALSAARSTITAVRSLEDAGCTVPLAFFSSFKASRSTVAFVEGLPAANPAASAWFVGLPPTS